ncbi:MAG: DUF3224 domain-containing protein [Chloroflexota bacterium]
MSRTRILSLVLILFVALAGLAGISGAVAASPEPVSGTFFINAATVNGIRFAGSNTFIDVSATVDYTGSLNGTSTLNGTLIVHADGVTANFHGIEVFTGTVDGVAGTLTFNNSGQTQSDLSNRDNLVVVSGTGGLSDLHGVINLVGILSPPNGPVGTYTGQLRTTP